MGSSLDKQEIEVAQVLLYIAEERFAEASTWTAQWLAASHPLDYRSEAGHLACVHVWIAQKKYREACSLLASLLPIAEKQHRLRSVIDILLLQTRVLDNLHNHPQTLKTLIRALLITQPENYIRLYLDEGEPMQHLLHALLTEWRRNPHIDTHNLTEYVTILVTVHDGYRKHEEQTTSGNNLLIEPLSEREMEVLQMLAHGASNQEIVDALVVTLSTVKKHVGNIMAKLSVTSRTQAIIHARDLRLL